MKSRSRRRPPPSSPSLRQPSPDRHIRGVRQSRRRRNHHGGPPVTPAPAPAPGEDTAPLEPMVQAEPPAAAPAPGPAAPRRSSGLARADGGDRGGGGGEAELRLATTHGATPRPSRAAPPRPAPAPADAWRGPCASVLVAAADTATQPRATPLGARATALDGNGHALLLAERGRRRRAPELTSARVVESARDWSRTLPPPARPPPHRSAVRADLSLRVISPPLRRR